MENPFFFRKSTEEKGGGGGKEGKIGKSYSDSFCHSLVLFAPFLPITFLFPFLLSLPLPIPRLVPPRS